MLPSHRTAVFCHVLSSAAALIPLPLSAPATSAPPLCMSAGAAAVLISHVGRTRHSSLAFGSALPSRLGHDAAKPGQTLTSWPPALRCATVLEARCSWKSAAVGSALPLRTHTCDTNTQHVSVRHCASCLLAAPSQAERCRACAACDCVCRRRALPQRRCRRATPARLERRPRPRPTPTRIRIAHLHAGRMLTANSATYRCHRLRATMRRSAGAQQASCAPELWPLREARCWVQPARRILRAASCSGERQMRIVPAKSWPAWSAACAAAVRAA